MKRDVSRLAICVGLILSMAMVFSGQAAPAECSCGGSKECANKPVVRAADWVAAWQAAKQACPSGDTVTFTFVDRAGARAELQKSAPGVELSAVGELVIVTVKVGGADVESVTVIRAVDLFKVEITRKSGAARR